MKIINGSCRFLMTGLVALSLAVALAPQAHAAASAEPSTTMDRAGYPFNGGGKDGQETHGKRHAEPVNGGGKDGQETNG